MRAGVQVVALRNFSPAATTTCWTTWLLLGQQQAAEARFHQELAAVLGGRAPAAEDLKALGYTGQVVQESMRMYPPSFGQRRCLGAGFATAEMITVLAVAGQRVRLRPASAEPVTIIPAVTQRPDGSLPMLVEVRS